MLRFVISRLLSGAVQIGLLLLLVFLAVRVTGDPATVLLPATATAEDITRLNQSLGLDQPIPVQLWIFFGQVLQGDFGRSFRGSLPVGPLVLDRLYNTAQLACLAALVAVLWAIPLGVLSARRSGTVIDRIARTVAVVGFAIPNFVLGIILIRVFAVNLGWLPVAGMGTPQHYVLPAVTLGAAVGAGMMRLMRSGMLDVREEPFMRTAEAKGLSAFVVVWRHQFRAALMPVLTYTGMYFGTLFGGSVVVEVVFAWPGMGRLAYEAAIGRDYPVLQAIVLILGVIIICVNTLVDLLYAYVDPRIRFGSL